jgi:hypothetical protein
MAETKNGRELFDMLAKVLLRCFVMGYCVLLLWAGVFLVGGYLTYDIAARLFGLSPHEVDMVNYCGMAFVKLIVILFFLIPYLAIRLVLRKAADDSPLGSPSFRS